ncbi:hypothetical protein D3C72_2186400 [compost metagenome]
MRRSHEPTAPTGNQTRGWCRSGSLRFAPAAAKELQMDKKTLLIAQVLMTFMMALMMSGIM